MPADQRVDPSWIKDETGKRVGWEVNDYSVEGERNSHRIVDDVVKYQRTIATTMNVLFESGFSIDRASESYATPEGEKLYPDLVEERIRLPFLFARAISE